MTVAVSGHGNTAHSAAQPLRLWFGLPVAIGQASVVKHNGRCLACGADGSQTRLHVDHIKPRSLFPELALVEDNLQLLCEACNLGKMAWDQTDWRNNADRSDRI